VEFSQSIGKTTTLSILSGEFPPTSGAAFIAGHDIATEQNKLRRKIGYCPQFSALLVRPPPPQRPQSSNLLC
jgi:ABC-type multidrug transport system ATPase subunit